MRIAELLKLRGKEKMQDPFITAALSGVNEENRLWRAVHQILQNQIEDETMALLAPNLTDAASHYNRGRVAALTDLQSVLEQARAKAQKPPG